MTTESLLDGAAGACGGHRRPNLAPLVMRKRPEPFSPGRRTAPQPTTTASATTPCAAGLWPATTPPAAAPSAARTLADRSPGPLPSGPRATVPARQVREKHTPETRGRREPVLECPHPGPTSAARHLAFSTAGTGPGVQ